MENRPKRKIYRGTFFSRFSELRKQIGPKILDKWLDDRVGWVEVDSLCQSTFGAEEMLEKWSQWEKLIKGLNKSSNINKRRASLVLLTKPVKDPESKKISDLAFFCIDNLKSERDILITKAISWLLRNLIKYNKEKVTQYLEANRNILPKIAIRERLGDTQKLRAVLLSPSSETPRVRHALIQSSLEQ